MKKLFLLMIVGMFLITLAAAEVQELKQVERFESVTLRQKYANSTYSNITTITYPNDTQINLNVNMAGSNGLWEYVWNDTEQIGWYEYCTRTDVDGADTDVCISFEVTPDGFSDTLGFNILILAISLGIIILGFALKDAPIVILGSFGLYFIGLRILFYGIAGMKDTIYTWGLGIIVLMVAAYISIKSAYELITN